MASHNRNTTRASQKSPSDNYDNAHKLSAVNIIYGCQKIQAVPLSDWRPLLDRLSEPIYRFVPVLDQIHDELSALCHPGLMPLNSSVVKLSLMYCCTYLEMLQTSNFRELYFYYQTILFIEIKYLVWGLLVL